MANKSHVYANNYKNNSNYFDGEGVIINGIKFNDFSFYAGRNVGPVYGSILSPTGEQRVPPSILGIQNAIQAYANGTGNIDHLNKITPMMYVNWNGAEITRGDFESGETYEISTTPEFLSIFNNVTSILYERVAKYLKIDNRIKRNKVKKVTINNDTTLTSISETLNDYEVLNIIYDNTENKEILITVNHNVNATDNSGCNFIVPNGSALYVMIQPYGFGEISFMRRGTKIYVRGM